MKSMKRLLAAVLCASMMFAIIGIESFAAYGELRFNDPSTTVGATVEITPKLTADYSLDSVSATLTYDPTYLKFMSGENATADNGTVTLTGTAGGNTEVSWSLQFQALQEGSTSITIATVSATDTDGDSVEVTQGNSAITVGPGDPSLIVQDEPAATTTSEGAIEINGVSYTVVTDFEDVLIPEGFARADWTYNGQTYSATKMNTGEAYAVCLKDPEGYENFFLYDPDAQMFSPFVQIKIADSRYIYLLSEDKSEDLPEELQKTTMAVEGKEFPAWQNMSNSAFYVVYAINSDGQKNYYQYDTVDSTYQRYTPAQKEEEKTDAKTGILNKLRDNLDKVIMVVWGIFLFMLLVIIITTTKLRHRNAEIDDLYEEYGIDDEEPEKLTRKEKKAQKKAEKAAKKDKKAKKSTRKKEDDFYDFEDEDDMDELEEEFEEDDVDFDDSDDDFEYEDDDDFDYEDDEDDDFDFDDDDDLDDLEEAFSAPRVRQTPKSSLPKVGPSETRRVGHSDIDDTFKMDLIDLD